MMKYLFRCVLSFHSILFSCNGEDDKTTYCIKKNQNLWYMYNHEAPAQFIFSKKPILFSHFFEKQEKQDNCKNIKEKK